MSKRNCGFDGNVIDLLRQVRDAGIMINRYFHWDSPVLKAIENYIWKANPCLLIDRPLNGDGKEMAVRTGRGQVCVSFAKAEARGVSYATNKPVECEYYTLEVRVVFYDEEEDYNVEKKYSFNIPIDLEENFTEEKFDAWVKNTVDANRRNAMFSELPKLKALIAKYPDEAKKLLSN
jgi:hypothetical protein